MAFIPGANGQPSQFPDGINLSTSSAGLGLPAGTTAQRPSNPTVGMTRFNTDLGYQETFGSDGLWQASSVAGIAGQMNAAVGGIVQLNKINAPFTTIVNRAKMVDLSSDLGVRMGIERIPVQQIMRVDGETGPNGEAVWKPVNDKYDQIRFVGGWPNKNINNATGQYNQATNNATDFIEISFYGTGLNLLVYTGSSTYTAVVSVDGGLETTWYPANASASSVLASRNYSANSIMSVSSGLTLGLHTAKIRSADLTNGLVVYGFEILNESSSLTIASGTSYVGASVLKNLTTTTSSYNSGFESGSLGTKGGHVVVYQKSDGSIGKAVTPTDTSSATLTSANHANEEVTRVYNFREFGAGRADDFSTLVNSASARAFTLDDGTTTLVASSAQSAYNTYVSEGETIRMSTSSFITITFVGTGLDVSMFAGSIARDVDVSIDGAANVNLALASGFAGIKKVVSGLSYGTHTVKFTQTSANNPGFQSFIVYAPKKPSIPSGAVELADYFVMGDYAVVSGLSTAADREKMATGVLRKYSLREAVYAGTWNAITIDTSNFVQGQNISSTTSGASVTYTFFGTGCEWRTRYNSGTAVNTTFTLNGNSLTTYSAVTGLVTGVTGLTFSSAGSLTGTTGGGVSSPAALRISGLPLGIYTLKITNNNTTDLYPESLDIITPIHTPKFNSPFTVQNTLSVGSQGINDGRKFGSQLPVARNVAQAVGVINSPSTTSTTNIPAPDMSTTIKTSGNPIKISFFAPVNSTNNIGFIVYVDNVARTEGYANTFSGNNNTASFSCCIPVSAGFHKIDIYWTTATGTGTMYYITRTLTVEEIANS